MLSYQEIILGFLHIRKLIRRVKDEFGNQGEFIYKHSIIKNQSNSPRQESWMPILSSPYPVLQKKTIKITNLLTVTNLLNNNHLQKIKQ